MTTLIIARHGNTFEKDETPTRVGKHTDLPLTAKGLEQGAAIGRYLRDHKLIPDVVYASNLQRTQQTAEAAIKASGVSNPVFALDIFDEIDYGPDENKLEDAVIARLGAQAIIDWDEKALVPDGWIVDPAQIIQNWIDFGDQIRAHDDNETVLVVTSNGIARFAPHLTGDFDGFCATYDIKLATGALGVFEYIDCVWRVKDWGVRPA
jgi:probable phosphoglycerate mutase